MQLYLFSNLQEIELSAIGPSELAWLSGVARNLKKIHVSINSVYLVELLPLCRNLSSFTVLVDAGPLNQTIDLLAAHCRNLTYLSIRHLNRASHASLARLLASCCSLESISFIPLNHPVFLLGNFRAVRRIVPSQYISGKDYVPLIERGFSPDALVMDDCEGLVGLDLSSVTELSLFSLPLLRGVHFPNVTKVCFRVEDTAVDVSDLLLLPKLESLQLRIWHCSIAKLTFLKYLVTSIHELHQCICLGLNLVCLEELRALSIPIDNIKAIISYGELFPKLQMLRVPYVRRDVVAKLSRECQMVRPTLCIFIK